jgi:hypothetical protein
MPSHHLSRLRCAAAIALAAGLAACGARPGPTSPPTLIPMPTGESTSQPGPSGEASATPEPTATLIPTPGPSPTTPPAVGPVDYPPDVNPLTGLAVDDPAVLDRAPVIVKISNESDEVRPQSGLSFADHVWMYQTEGWRQTRFAAVFYSRAPEHAGSVRSARPIDEALLKMYDGLLVISGASKEMWGVILYSPWSERVFRDDASGHLVRIPDVPRENTDYYHTLFAVPEVVWEHADERGVNDPPDLAGLRFDASPPEGGTPTAEMNIDYPDYGPLQTWRYDRATGRWLSWTEIQLDPVVRESTPDVDYLTGKQLAFDNVVMLWAEHFWAEGFVETPTADVNLEGEGDAVVLRDGMRYEVTWRRDDEEAMIGFYDANGEPFALKPGTTWFHTARLPTADFTPEVTFK